MSSCLKAPQPPGKQGDTWNSTMWLHHLIPLHFLSLQVTSGPRAMRTSRSALNVSRVTNDLGHLRTFLDCLYEENMYFIS